MLRPPLPNGATAVTGEIIGNQIQVALRIRLVERLQQRKIPRGMTGERCLRQRLAISYAERAIHPPFLRSSGVVQGDFDAMARGRPARSWGEVARSHGSYLIDTADRRVLRWGGVERDDRRSFGTNSLSVLVAHNRVLRQRTPSWRKIRRT